MFKKVVIIDDAEVASKVSKELNVNEALVKSIIKHRNITTNELIKTQKVDVIEWKFFGRFTVRKTLKGKTLEEIKKGKK